MERDDREMLEVTRAWRRTLRDWLRSTDPHIPVWQAFAAFVLLVLVAVFSLNSFLPGGIGDLIDELAADLKVVEEELRALLSRTSHEAP